MSSFSNIWRNNNETYIYYNNDFTREREKNGNIICVKNFLKSLKKNYFISHFLDFLEVID